MGNCDRKSEIIGIQVAKIGYVRAEKTENFRIIIQRTTADGLMRISTKFGGSGGQQPTRVQ